MQGWEWIIIGAVTIVILLWGPSKIPQLAKALGRATGEFRRSPKESTTSMSAQAMSTESVREKQENDDMLIATAKKLGISTDGKTRQRISEEISLKIKLLGTQ